MPGPTAVAVPEQQLAADRPQPLADQLHRRARRGPGRASGGRRAARSSSSGRRACPAHSTGRAVAQQPVAAQAARPAPPRPCGCAGSGAWSRSPAAPCPGVAVMYSSSRSSVRTRPFSTSGSSVTDRISSSAQRLPAAACARRTGTARARRRCRAETTPRPLEVLPDPPVVHADQDAVAGHPDVALDGVRADRGGVAVGRQGVLGRLRGRAAVGDDLEAGHRSGAGERPAREILPVLRWHAATGRRPRTRSAREPRPQRGAVLGDRGHRRPLVDGDRRCCGARTRSRRGGTG